MIHTPSPMPTAPIQVSIIFGDDRKLPFFAKQYNSHLGNFDSFQVPRRHTRISECKALPDMIVMKTPSSRPRWQWPPNSGTRKWLKELPSPWYVRASGCKSFPTYSLWRTVGWDEYATTWQRHHPAYLEKRMSWTKMLLEFWSWLYVKTFFVTVTHSGDNWDSTCAPPWHTHPIPRYSLFYNAVNVITV